MRKILVFAVMFALVLGVAPGAALAQDDDCVITFLTVWSGEDELRLWKKPAAPSKSRARAIWCLC